MEKSGVRPGRPIDGNTTTFIRTTPAQKVLHVPANLCILKNRANVLGFFRQADVHLGNGHPIHLDLSGITNLEPEALLYLVAYLDEHSKKADSPQISGNVPNDVNIRALLRCSGFYRHVLTNDPLGVDERIMSIESGVDVVPATANKIAQFAKGTLGIDISDDTNAHGSAQPPPRM